MLNRLRSLRLARWLRTGAAGRWLGGALSAAVLAVAAWGFVAHRGPPAAPTLPPVALPDTPAGGSSAQPGWAIGNITGGGPSAGGGGSGNVTAASCPASSLCVVGFASGELSSSGLPADGTWRMVNASDAPTTGITALACATSSLCVAADSAGDILWSTTPNGYGVQPLLWVGAPVDARAAVTGLACPTAALCVGVASAGNILTSASPTGGATAWRVAHVPSLGPQDHLAGVSCAGTTLCAAAVNGTQGSLVVTADPSGGAATWRRVSVPATWGIKTLSAVSCFAGGCLTVTQGGDVLAWASRAAAGSGSGWHLTTLGAPLASVSCGGPNFCVAAGGNGAFLSRHPLAPHPHWTTQDLGFYSVVAIASCPSASFCFLADVGASTAVYQK